jgi:hypothetical protein
MRTEVESQTEIIERIASETKTPVDVVQHDYLKAMQDLSAGARVRDYLSLFVTRRVKAKLRGRAKS